jgi:NAD(P)-dependent dehydrogenase (short-subunit alcohol dehydrogenase family)
MTHPFDLTGKVAVVTGGNGGIGLGMARMLARCGADVAIWGRNPEKNAKALEDARAVAAGRVEAWAVDVTDTATIEAAMADTLSHFGRVDGMFANAGVSSSGARKSFADRTLEEWHQLFAANLDGVVASFQAATRHMQERAQAGDGGGRLVVTSSVASIDGAAFNEHYGASKAAVNGLMRALAVELARYGVTVNSILPGYIVTEMTERLMTNDKFVEVVGKRIPMRRFGEPDDFGGIAAYLMSDLSRYHTGQTFTIDGGYTIF